jgi:hypothetical protein
LGDKNAYKLFIEKLLENDDFKKQEGEGSIVSR